MGEGLAGIGEKIEGVRGGPAGRERHGKHKTSRREH